MTSASTALFRLPSKKKMVADTVVRQEVGKKIKEKLIIAVAQSMS